MHTRLSVCGLTRSGGHFPLSVTVPHGAIVCSTGSASPCGVRCRTYEWIAAATQTVISRHRAVRLASGLRMSSTTPTSPTRNHLLDAMPAAEWERFAPHLTAVHLKLGDVLYESGTEQPHVYFPTDSIVSLLYVLENGASAEIAIVGNEGLVGISLFMGGGTTPSRAVVQSAGQAFRMKAQFVRDEFVLAGSVQHLFLRYTQALLTQMGQTAVCNRHHTVDQQLCRWLLMSLDRLSSNELTMTQELIANMLGVRREGVTEAAGKLQRAGSIGRVSNAWRASATRSSGRSSLACCLGVTIKPRRA